MLEPYPTGGRDSFIMAIVVSLGTLIIIFWKLRKKEKIAVHKQIWDWLRIEDTPIKICLLFLTFIALWLTIRVIGYFGRVYLFDEERLFSPLEILDIVAYVLTINLCITLLKSREVREIVNATIQSILLAIIVFLPRATSKDTTWYFGQHGAAVIMIGLSVLIISLMFTSKYLVVKERKDN